jgi:integrase
MRKLPRRVYLNHGSLWFVDIERKWHRLCRADAGELAMYQALAARIEALPLNRMPAAIARFKLEYLPGLAATTQKEHTRLLDVAADEFEEFDVADVQPSDVARSVRNVYGDQLVDGKPKRARLTAGRHYKARLSTFFRWCVEQGLRSSNPCREIWLKAPPRRDRYITDDEFGKIRAALLLGADKKPTRAGEMARAFAELCYLTLQRPTDVRHLLWSQVRDDVVAFRPSKTAGSSGARVLVPITPAIREVLDRARAFVPKTKKGKEQKELKSIYVVHALDGSPYTMSGLRSAWKRACERAEVKNATVKDLRAKALTDARRAGYGKEALQVAAAHSSYETTEIYLKPFEEPLSTVRLTLPELP